MAKGDVSQSQANDATGNVPQGQTGQVNQPQTASPVAPSGGFQNIMQMLSRMAPQNQASGMGRVNPGAPPMVGRSNFGAGAPAMGYGFGGYPNQGPVAPTSGFQGMMQNLGRMGSGMSRPQVMPQQQPMMFGFGNTGNL